MLFFLSGAAALVYEVLWLKELGRLFGVTVYAASTTLAVFFLGLAAGGFVWGRRAERLERPLRTYALLEAGIAGTALLYFLLLGAYHTVYAPLYGLVGHRPALFLLVKFVLSVGILFPPAFFMGGTLPVIGQYLVRQSDRLGRTASLLYAINTIGAATGALLAGFFLPRWVGFRASYLLAIAMNLLIGVIAYAGSGARTAPIQRDSSAERAAAPAGAAPLSAATIGILAAVSGFLTLALEVLWTRMFAQVLQNSVYTFAVILTVFLAALAVGSTVANRLCRLSYPPGSILTALLVLSGFAVGLTPWIFYALTDGLQAIGISRGWTGYVLSVFGSAAAVLLVPGIVIGTVFPYLMKLSEAHSKSAGRTIGQLGAINTTCAILGSLAAGFLLLDLIGLWGSLRAVGVAYLVLAMVVPRSASRGHLALRGAAALGAVLFAFVITYAGYAKVLLEPGTAERVLELREGSQGTVAVVDHDGDLRIKVNNSYKLGTSKSAPNERIQTWLPLGLHPRPRSVFFLGMGTGITAGAALACPVERVVVCELNPDVVRVSRKHFGPFLFGLFTDPRAEVLVEDGRNFLYATDETFDLIIADLFLTYRAGIGSLYTLEHFRAVRERLEPGGLFIQWLPLFDLSFEEFAIVTRTMLEVYPEVTVWRRSVSPRFPVVGLVARMDPTPLDPARLERHLASLVEGGLLPEGVWLGNIPLAAYMGNARVAEALFESAPISTDDRTPLEYLGPITNRNSRGSGVAAVLEWDALARFGERLLEAAPPETDPFLREVDPARRRQIPAGLAYYRYVVASRSGRSPEAAAHLQTYQRLLGVGAD